jgi:hydroxymethylbilane synthase
LELLDAVEHIYPISLMEMIPAMGQGALGIQCVDDPEVIKIAEQLEDEYSRIETTIERDFVDMLEGGCQVPIGVNAFVQDNGDVIVRSLLGLPNGHEVLGETKIVRKEEYANAGREMAQRLIDKGAKELLERAEEQANNIKSTL